MTQTDNNIIYTPYSTGYQTGDDTSKSGNAVSGQLIDQNLVIPEIINGQKVIKIGQYSFYCIKITSLTLPDTIIEIGYSAFDNCHIKNDEITLPKSLTKIGINAFSFDDIKRYYIGDQLESIGYGAFSDNTELKNITVSNDNRYYISINGALYNKNITTLYCCPYLYTDYRIPFTIIILLRRSLCIKGITTLYIPHSVTTIQVETFFLMPSLRTIHFLGNIETIQSGCIFTDRTNKVQSVFYHGTMSFNKTNSFSNFPNMKVYVCNDYVGDYFALKKVIKSGSCYNTVKTCARSRKSISFFITLTFLVISS